MAVDGEAWELPKKYAHTVSFKTIKRDFTSMLPFFVKEHGSEMFGYVEIPIEDLIEAVMHDEEIGEQFQTFEDYHDWYLSQGHMPRHGPRGRWPVILSSFDEETLQDGWHRFHHYIRQGARMIPAVYYP